MKNGGVSGVLSDTLGEGNPSSLGEILGEAIRKQAIKRAELDFNEKLTKRLQVIVDATSQLFDYSRACSEIGLDKMAKELFDMARNLGTTKWGIQTDYREHLEKEIKELKKLNEQLNSKKS